MATREETAAELTTRMIVALLGAGTQSQVNMQAEKSAEAAGKHLSALFDTIFEAVNEKLTG